MKQLYKFKAVQITEGFVYAESEKEALGILAIQSKRIKEEASLMIEEINDFDLHDDSFDDDYLVYGTNQGLEDCRREQYAAEASQDYFSSQFEAA